MAKSQIIVRSLSARSQRGWVALGPLRWPCALGRGGISARKREGDGATPLGSFRLLQGYRRRDKFPLMGHAAHLIDLQPDTGWCDAPADANYNRKVRHPYAASAEQLWRSDDLYDCLVVLDYNIRPRMRQRGSAIFLHVARADLAPTEGCVALRKRDLRQLLRYVRPGTRLVVGPLNKVVRPHV